MEMDHELIEYTKRLNDATQYDIAALKALYSDDFLIYRLDNRGEATILDKQTTMAYFKGKRNEDEAHQDDAVEFLHASKSGDVGMVVGKRTMQVSNSHEELIFTQVWRLHPHGWQIIRESVFVQSGNSERALKG